MTSIAKLKDRARKHEQREDWDAAIRAYQQVLETEERKGEVELELGLFNRIGDLYLRLGQTEDAVSYYVTAADKYAESGFFNNAIALCNKALRHRPERADLYQKLSGLCAEQGFITDARRWILEYAERQMRGGHVERALESLEEFADMSDDPEIRELLARQLASHGREGDAVEQLRRAYQLRTERGERAATEAVAERARVLDPAVTFERETADEPEEFGFEGRSQEPAVLPGLDTHPEEPSKDPGAGPDPFDAGEAEKGAGGDLSGLEVSQSERGAGVPGAPETDALGGLERFDADEEEEPEPLPLLGAEDEDESPEEPEPLPLLDTGYDQEAAEEVGPEAVPDVVEAPEPEPGPVAAESADDDGAAVDEPGAVESFDLGGEGMPALDLGGIGGNAAPEEGAMDEVHGHAPPDDAMDLDLTTFDLGMGEEGPVRAEDLDVDAVLNRAKQQVSRGLTSEALRELRLLSRGTVPPEAYRQAFSVATEIVRHNANDVEALQRRVEYATRIGDTAMLVDAYVDLADALGRLGSEAKAQGMYQKVLSLDPQNEAAREALGAPPPPEEEEFDLGAVLQEMEADSSSEAPTSAGDEDPGLAEMLSQFRAKVNDPSNPEKAADHYDLGLAFKEMGLIDEAIAEFQTALSGETERLKVFEELGQCFMLKGRYDVAVKVLIRGLQAPHEDESELLGVYYHLGQSYEELGHKERARDVYEKVLSIDGSFADVPSRVARL